MAPRSATVRLTCLAGRYPGQHALGKEGWRAADRILQTYRFGPHRVDLAERADDDGTAAYHVLVDGMVVTDPPLDTIPRFEDMVRIYAQFRDDIRRPVPHHVLGNGG